MKVWSLTLPLRPSNPLALTILVLLRFFLDFFLDSYGSQNIQNGNNSGEKHWKIYLKSISNQNFSVYLCIDVKHHSLYPYYNG